MVHYRIYCHKFLMLATYPVLTIVLYSQVHYNLLYFTGYTGDSCETLIWFCPVDNCQNGGQCSVVDNVGVVCDCIKGKFLGPVVQSIVSLTTSLRHQRVKYMPTKLSNTLLFFVEKM